MVAHAITRSHQLARLVGWELVESAKHVLRLSHQLLLLSPRPPAPLIWREHQHAAVRVNEERRFLWCSSRHLE